MSTGLTLPPPVVASIPSPSRSGKSSPMRALRVHWDHLKQLNRAIPPSESNCTYEDNLALESIFDPNPDPIDEGEFDLKPLDVVVVDRVWTDDTKASTAPNSEHGQEQASSTPRATASDYEHSVVGGDYGRCLSWNPLLVVRHRIYPALVAFFNPSFIDEEAEVRYRQESWYYRKPLARWAASWFILNWALGCLFAHQRHLPLLLPDKIFYFGIAPVFSLPVIAFVITDLAREQPIWYQAFMTFSVWMWPTYQILYMYLCGFYTGRPIYFSCENKDFMGTLYYACAMQTIALFGLNMKRSPAVIGALSFIVITFSLIVPDRVTWTRSMINILAFYCFLVYTHYMTETFERRNFFLRDRLKVEFRATQRAQINERKSADSKRRLTSYVFHDKCFTLALTISMLIFCPITQVRVPLNTALLAVQNMSARRDATANGPKEQDIEFSALEGSLSMMSKVLNDVLDFNRMDSGKFEQACVPYAFHQIMRSLLVPLQLATEARGLELVIDLDPQIDIVARRAAYEAMGEPQDAIEKHIKDHPDVDGIVVGDEVRLRQIITNLASNGCKFTKKGGKLSIKTRLILPGKDRGAETFTFPQTPDSLSTTLLSQHNFESSAPAELDRIVVRIEVCDTGYGISQTDMTRGRLFSAFNQTEQGRQQGGKGTGLGLALVRQIVKLSGGRLGVKSAKGKGSMFWVELPLGVGRKTLPKIPPTVGDVALDSVDGHVGSVMSSEEYSLPMADAAMSIRPLHNSIRSTSALHGLMEQGGSVELKLSLEDNCSVPTRTIGDQSTGTQVANLADSTTCCASDEGAGSSKSIRSPPTYLRLPSFPTSFNLGSDGTPNSERSTPDLNSDARTGILDIPKLNVLVVDDDPLTRTLMTRLLQRLGCTVTTAENGRIALDYLHVLPPVPPSPTTAALEFEHPPPPDPDPGTSPFDLVFLDNSMPVLTGLAAVTRLREVGRDDFVVGVTGNALITDQKEYLEAGANHVLTKPVYEKSLKEMLVLAEQRRRQQEQSL